MGVDDLILPRIELNSGQAIPIVYLPEEGYEERVRVFLQSGGRESVTEYAKDLGALLRADIRLNWDDRLGLVNIGIGPSAGFDLDERSMKYSVHNIYSLEQAVPVFLVATKYVSML